MASLTANRGLLLTLARHLRPKVTAELADHGALIVASATQKLEVEVFTDVDPKTPLTIVYRNTRTRDQYGSIANPETAAAAILDTLAKNDNV